MTLSWTVLIFDKGVLMQEEHLRESRFPVDEISNMEFAIVLPDITTPDSEALQKILKNPSLIPTRLRMHLLRDILVEDYNHAVVMLTSEFTEFEDQHPAEALVTRMVIEAWLTVHGYRLVKDDKISSSIAQERQHQKKGFLRRLLEDMLLSEGEKQTALIQENLDLAAKNETLKRHNLGVQAQAQTILTDAQRRADEQTRQAADELQKATNQKLRLEKEINRLTQLKNQLLADPGVAAAVNHDAFFKPRERYETLASNLALRLTQFHLNTTSKSAITRYFELLIEITDLLLEIDQEHGAEVRIYMVEKIIKLINDNKFSLIILNKGNTKFIAAHQDTTAKIFFELLKSDASVEEFKKDLVELQGKISRALPDSFNEADYSSLQSTAGMVMDMHLELSQ